MVINMKNYPAGEAENRFAAIRRGMEEDGLDVMLVYGTQWKLENVHYVANYRTLGVSACVVLPLEQDPVLFICEPGDIVRAHDTSWIKDIRLYDGRDISGPANLARNYGGTVGVVSLGIMTTEQRRALGKAFGDGVRDGLRVLDQAAIIKTDWEKEILRECGKLADIGFLAQIASIRPGLREFELAADMNEAMIRAGADDNFQMLAAGRDLSCMHVPRESAIQPGDLILAEITPMKGCITYAAQLCRTAKLGEATPVEREKYALLVTALKQALAIIKPGVRAGDIAKIQNRIIGAQDYEQYCRPPYMRSRGHNFGLGQFELTEDNDMKLRPGMCMVVHPNQYLPETGYLACGEMVLVTETGVERLSRLTMKLYEVEEVTV